MLPLQRQHRDLMMIERKPCHRLKKYDVPVFKRGNGQYVLHRTLRVDTDGCVLCGDNQYRREYGIRDEQIVGVMTGSFEITSHTASRIGATRPTSTSGVASFPLGRCSRGAGTLPGK